MDLIIREAQAEDADWIVTLNAACTPAVSEMTLDEFRHIEELSHAVLVAEDIDGARLGAMIVLARGRDYQSPNYRWFDQNVDSFLYVDRIMVDAGARRGGVGLALYSEALDMAEDQGAGSLTAEVNEEPPNPVSMAFHEKLGFLRIGALDHVEQGKRVVMLKRPTLNPDPVPA